MEKLNIIKKINKNLGAEELKIDGEGNINEHISKGYDLGVIKELEEKGDIKEVGPINSEDESYIKLKDLNLGDNFLN